MNKNKFLYIILFLCLNLLLSGCITKSISQKGFVFDEEDTHNITINVTNKDNVINYLGYPLNKSYFDDNLWIYYSYQTKEVLFFKPKIQNQKILLIKFNKNDRVENISMYNFDSNKIDIKDLNIKDDYKKGILEDIFKNIGQINMTQ